MLIINKSVIKQLCNHQTLHVNAHVHKLQEFQTQENPWLKQVELSDPDAVGYSSPTKVRNPNKKTTTVQ